MDKLNEQKWREEFVLELAKKLRDDNDEEAMKQIADAVERGMWDDKLHFYLAARKKAQEEIDLIRSENKKEQTGSDVEIRRFKDVAFRMGVKIVKRDKLLEQAKPYVEILLNEAVSKNFYVDLPNYEQWLKDYEELKK